ncbi:MAG: glycoside hydrolase family 5 protein [Treponema sp.]|nr:glycoside hydrolase family 5 protein [Treponema sp.]
MRDYRRTFVLAALLAAFAGFLGAESSVKLLNRTVELSWSDNVTVDSAAFSDVKAGDTIELKYKNIKADYHKFKVYGVGPSGWQPLGYGGVKGAGFANGDLETEKSSGSIVLTLTEDDAANLKKGGLIMHGYGLKVSAMTLAMAAGTVSVPANKRPHKPNTEPKSVSDGRAQSGPVGGPFAEHGRLHVDGAYLYDSHNSRYQLHGMSTHGLAWFGGYINKDGFRTLRDDWNANVVRLALYPGEYNGYCNGGNQEELKKLVCDGIDYASSLGMYVIVDWHVLSANPNQYKEAAKTFFADISRKYGSYGNVLYEICNEPTGSDWDRVLKPYAEELIPVIRQNDPDGIVIVGTNTWSQEVDKAAKNPITAYRNVMYTLHFYADTHTQWMRDRLEAAVKASLPVFVTEFGTCDASGNGGFNAEESRAWFDLMSKYGISCCNWSLCNKDETASVIKSSCKKLSGWGEGDLTESGRLVRQYFRGLKK